MRQREVLVAAVEADVHAQLRKLTRSIREGKLFQDPLQQDVLRAGAQLGRAVVRALCPHKV